LIVPALAARFYAQNRRLVVAYIIGILGFILGLIGSALWDLPSGALIVWTLAVIGITAGVISTLFNVEQS
jgi:zinc/manganese transport system permease protein